MSGEVERCTWAQSDGLLREQRPSQFDVLLTAVSVQQTPAFLLSFARHAVLLVCWVGFLVGNSVFTRQGFVFFGVILAFSVFLSVIPVFLNVQRAPSGGPGTNTPLRLKHGVWFLFVNPKTNPKTIPKPP